MKDYFLNYDNKLVDQDSTIKYSADIKSGNLNDIMELNFSISEPFIKKEIQLNRLFSNEPIDFNTNFFNLLETQTSRNTNKNDLLATQTTSAEVKSSNIFLKPWKNVENISTRLIEAYDGIVKLECLMDKENGIYEEREFKSSFFEGYNINKGNFFLIRIFERPNEMRMEIHDDLGLTLKNDFPKFSFVDNFKNSSLFKKK